MKLFLIYRTRLCSTPARIISTTHLNEGRYLFFLIFPRVDGSLFLKHEIFSVIL